MSDMNDNLMKKGRGRPKKEKLYAVESVASWKDIKPAD